MAPAGRPIVIYDYDESWPLTFVQLRDGLPQALCELAVAIEHVGSTSVPGLAAKGAIDMDVVVPTSADIPEAIRLLASAGYEHLGDRGIPGREAFTPPAGLPDHHLYVCAAGAEPLLAHLRLRDRLRASPQDAADYAALKRALAARFGSDRDGYTEAKSEFIERLLES
jgi:GrpB-like predicted nucleotidyltransferase (UPF0157 family)